MIAANVDCVLIVQSCHFDFNPKRLERYLVMVMEGGAEPFRKLIEETAFNDRSYAQKRKKDRDFGRFIKSAKKDLPNG